MVKSSLRASGSILAAYFLHQQLSCSLLHGALSSMTTHQSRLMVETAVGAVVGLGEEVATIRSLSLSDDRLQPARVSMCRLLPHFSFIPHCSSNFEREGVGL
jgi:hypothetical protein